MMVSNCFEVARLSVLAARRNRLMRFMTVLSWVLLLIGAIAGYQQYNNALRQRLASEHLVQQEWEHQERNPHAAAHWGTYLFKPYPFISLYDAGLSVYTGSYYRVEAHKQHQVNAVNLQDSEDFLRMSDLTVARIFQLLIPLLIIFQGFSSLTEEREQQTLKLLLVQGLRPVELVWGKVFGNYMAILWIIVPFFLLMGLAQWLDPMGTEGARLLAFMLTYLFYFFVLTVMVVLVSLYSVSSRSSLLSCSCLWIGLVVLFPKIISGWADRKYSLPSSYLFEHDVKEGFDKGMGRDGNYVERSKAYLHAFLGKYGVDSIAQLPKNIAFALDLLQAERYNNRVYRHYSSLVEQDITRQQRIVDIAGFFDPLLAVRQLSMGFAGTDFYHHMDFYRKAQDYRNAFHETLNKRMLDLGERGEVFALKDAEAFYGKMERFHYHFPPCSAVWRQHLPAVFSLFWWLILLICIVPLLARKKLLKTI